MSTPIYPAKYALLVSPAPNTSPFSKNHFIFGYKRFVSYLGRHPKTLRSDQGTEILNKELSAYLEANHTNHIVCSKDEHASIGAAENSIGVLRTSAKAMMLAGNIPKGYWQFVVSHAAYLNNIVAPSRCDHTKTIFEILFGRRADVRRIPPIGAFCAVYSDRRQLLYQYDVQVAFIQSVIDPNHPPVYCEPAEGYEDRRHYVFQLHKHLYGMKDSPRGWSKLFTSVCLKYGFSQLKSDECVFVKIVPNTKSGKSASTFSAVLDTLPNVPEHERVYKDCPYESCLVILCSYVDDILAFTNCQSLADDFLAHCNKRFTMTCDGEAHWYLSAKYTRDPSGAVSASQELYIDKILKRWGMESCKPLPTPFPAKSDVVLDEILKPIENPDPELNKQFQEIIGQLLYCQQQTVPEISWSVSILARFNTKAGAPHMALAKKVLRYLQGRKRIPLHWCARSCQQPHLPGHIYGYADASFADIKPDRLSSMGYVFIINNGAVSWRSTRTPLVTLSADLTAPG
jgi:hypothetical protein